MVPIINYMPHHDIQTSHSISVIQSNAASFQGNNKLACEVTRIGSLCESYTLMRGQFLSTPIPLPVLIPTLPPFITDTLPAFSSPALHTLQSHSGADKKNQHCKKRLIGKSPLSWYLYEFIIIISDS